MIAIDLDALAVGADEPDLFVIGKIGEVAGGLDGLGDGGFADVELAARAVSLRHRRNKRGLPDIHRDGQADVILGHIEVMNFILQFARRFAGGLNRADVGQGDGAVFLDGFLDAVRNCDRQCRRRSR